MSCTDERVRYDRSTYPKEAEPIRKAVNTSGAAGGENGALANLKNERNARGMRVSMRAQMREMRAK